jgi:hypothetical protein
MTNEPYGYLMSDSDDEELFVPVNPFKSRKVWTTGNVSS